MTRHKQEKKKRREKMVRYRANVIRQLEDRRQAMIRRGDKVWE